MEEIGYSAFGYEADMKTAVKNFVIYGQSGSAAQRYASDSDDTYGYKNSFSFVTVQDASKVRGGRDSEDLPTQKKSAVQQKQLLRPIPKTKSLVLTASICCWESAVWYWSSGQFW